MPYQPDGGDNAPTDHSRKNMELLSVSFIGTAFIVLVVVIFFAYHAATLTGKRSASRHKQPPIEKWKWRPGMPMTQNHLDAYQVMLSKWKTDAPDTTLVGYLPFYAILVTLTHLAGYLLGDMVVGMTVMGVILGNEGLMVIRGYRGHHLASCYRLIILGSMLGHWWAALLMLTNAIIAMNAGQVFVSLAMAVMWAISIVGRSLGKTIVRHVKEAPRSLLA